MNVRRTGSPPSANAVVSSTVVHLEQSQIHERTRMCDLEVIAEGCNVFRGADVLPPTSRLCRRPRVVTTSHRMSRVPRDVACRSQTTGAT